MPFEMKAREDSRDSCDDCGTNLYFGCGLQAAWSDKFCAVKEAYYSSHVLEYFTR